VTRNPAIVDAGVAVAIALVVIALEPGVAVGVAVALVALVFCGLTLVFDRRRARRRPEARPRRR